MTFGKLFTQRLASDWPAIGQSLASDLAEKVSQHLARICVAHLGMECPML